MVAYTCGIEQNNQAWFTRAIMTEVQEIWQDISEGFDNKFKNAVKMSLTKQYEACLIVAHGDLDGIVSAAMMKHVLKHNCAEIECGFYRPHYIKIHNPKATKEENKGIITKPYDLIVIVDIAVNNRDYNTVFKFIESVKHKLLWIDHHYTKRSLPNCIIKKKDSCVELIQEIFPLAKYPKKVNDIIRMSKL